MKKGSGIAWTSRPEVFSKKVFLKFSQNPQENTCTRGPFLMKLLAWACNLFEKILWHKCFSANFWKIFKNTFFTEQLWTAASE